MSLRAAIFNTFVDEIDDTHLDYGGMSDLLEKRVHAWMDAQVQPDLFETISKTLDEIASRHSYENICLDSTGKYHKSIVAILGHAVMLYEAKRDPDAHKQAQPEAWYRVAHHHGGYVCNGCDTHYSDLDSTQTQFGCSNPNCSNYDILNRTAQAPPAPERINARFEAAKAFGAAMVGATQSGSSWPAYKGVAQESVKYADALLAELGRTGEGVSK